jgi:hypothetical protein
MEERWALAHAAYWPRYVARNKELHTLVDAYHDEMVKKRPRLDLLDEIDVQRGPRVRTN